MYHPRYCAVAHGVLCCCNVCDMVWYKDTVEVVFLRCSELSSGILCFVLRRTIEALEGNIGDAICPYWHNHSCYLYRIIIYIFTGPYQYVGFEI